MTLTIRTASLLTSISGLLIAPPALSAEPPQSAAAKPQSTSTAVATSTEVAPTAVPAPAAVAPSSNSAENATVPAAPKAAPEPQNSPASVATSPYGPSNSSPLLPAPKTKDEERKDTYNGPPTLLDMSGDYAIGGFGGIGVMYTRFAGRGAVQVCGEGALILDHKLTLGGGGCGITTAVNAEKYGPQPSDPNDRMHFGYGGAIIRYHVFTNRLINLGIGALVGAGGVSIGTWDGSGQDWSTDYSHMRTEAVFVFEPQIGAYCNVTRWLRIGANVGYRVVSGVDTQGLSSSDFSAPTIGGVLQGGWF